jgi:hypothetical protein
VDDSRYLECLAADYGDHLARDGQDTITVLAGQTAWTVRPSPREVVVDDGASDNPRVVIAAAPEPMLRWLWGRAGSEGEWGGAQAICGRCG